ncbi:MAG: hypothetical protein HeimAB125_18040 [Candidatus Heimdallarchaeota archaeon AB_125]|nr:MAG: hypothetical protein HeimAB125_18040 [Candidatus Heimdallarchaeota archaeon AB_125]
MELKDLSEAEDSFDNEISKIKELENRINSIKIRYRLAILTFFILSFIWIITLQNIDATPYAILLTLGSSIGLALGSFAVLTAAYYFFKFIIFLFKPDPDAPMVSKEEREKAEWEKVRLTTCSNCMLVYDARRLNCPECGKETMRKEKNTKEIIQGEEE